MENFVGKCSGEDLGERTLRGQFGGDEFGRKRLLNLGGILLREGVLGCCWKHQTSEHLFREFFAATWMVNCAQCWERILGEEFRGESPSGIR